MKGDYVLARKYAQDSLSVLRDSESGMTFRGPTALGVYAIALENSDTRREVLQEAEKILEGDCLAGNRLDFYEHAIQACLHACEWNEVDRYAQALEDYTKGEPIPRCTLIINRGRALSAHGRGNTGRSIIQELGKLQEEFTRAELKFALPELEAALKSV